MKKRALQVLKQDKLAHRLWGHNNPLNLGQIKAMEQAVSNCFQLIQGPPGNFIYNYMRDACEGSGSRVGSAARHCMNYAAFTWCKALCSSNVLYKRVGMTKTFTLQAPFAWE